MVLVGWLVELSQAYHVGTACKSLELKVVVNATFPRSL